MSELTNNSGDGLLDRIDLFRVFVRVVDFSSFTRAAGTLGLPRSSVSAAVQTLEKRLGTRLLNRTTRSVSPTHDGTAFYQRCLMILADVEDAERQFSALASLPTGKVRVEVPGRIGRLVIAPALPEFLNAYPEIEVVLGVTDRNVNLVEENIDCALRVGPLPDSGLIARPLGELQLINVASRDYIVRHGMPRSPESLGGHSMVRYASPSTGRIEDWEWMQDGALHALAVRGRVTVNSAEAHIACCLAGLGLIQVPAYDVKEQLASGDLVEVMRKYRAPPLPITLLYPHRQNLSRRLKVFTDWLQKLLRAEVLN